MIILSIETSCDDTGVALLEINQQGNFNIKANIVSSQIALHAPFGGVVPALAAREHTKNILLCLEQAFTAAALAPAEVDLIAVTIGPGLKPALLVGVTAAKSLAYKWQKPLIGINHLEGHVSASFIGQIKNHKSEIIDLRLPAVCLIVSGGHTLLVLIKKFGEYQILGETLDDAAGEAFDKIARILGLGYPGGPAIAAAAAKIPNYKSQITNKLQKSNNKFQIRLPRPMVDSKNYNFSFSGLKTAVLYNFKKQSEKTKKSKNYIQAMAAEAQQAIVDVLVVKTIKAAQEFRTNSVMLAGGVAANELLRQTMQISLVKNYPQAELCLPARQFCTDNALMIALAAYFKISSQDLVSFKSGWRDLKVDPNLRLDETNF